MELISENGMNRNFTSFLSIKSWILETRNIIWMLMLLWV